MSDSSFAYTDERFADLQMLRYRLAGFSNLSLSQKKYVFFLSKATLVGRDITTDQFGEFNLLIRKTLEAVYTDEAVDRTTADFKGMEVYLKRVWFSNGIHHHYGCEKFVPEFSEAWFRKVVAALPRDVWERVGYTSADALLAVLCPVIFDPAVQPKRVNQAAGEDLVATSACNFYRGVSQQEAERFYAERRDPEAGDEQPSWGLNSKLVRCDGRLEEELYRTGGLYGAAIKQIVYWLKKAAEVAENDQQRKVIGLLVDYYETGDLRLFDQYSIEWLKEQEGMVDFINGFIEVYGDPLGLKGSWEGLVEYKDMVATRRTETISAHAQWFEDHSPVDPRFRKPQVKGVTAHVICAAMLGGDEYPASAIGINLPNADWIRARYGSKSVTIGNLTEAYNQAAHGNGFDDEFVIDEPTRTAVDRYGDVCDDLHTDLHECLGHGSGQLLPGVASDALKSYGSTIEEARADLFGLYYIADAELVRLGLVPDAKAYESQYYTYMMNGLMTQLVRIKPGHQIEEAHMRNRALIAHWCLEHGKNVVELVKRNGKTYVKINDYPALRTLFAQLLAEIQRIKSEGDYEAGKTLVERYAVKVDPVLHEEVLARYRKLNLAPYKGFINPWMKPVEDADGNIIDIELDYTEGYAHQMLRYSREYGLL
ncbi:MAG: dihydrofolate reductase [Hallella sp.]|mgnify:FL=1|uniref:dipeptidyl-peptidase 3 family protein n=1 Tax=Hallella sp. TaxID=2980186 RepID=UPI00258E6B5C|nr:dihydrofolate reductase [Hallella sp.]MDD7145128.1 dihydrofolate reductase [Hallella sp.]